MMHPILQEAQTILSSIDSKNTHYLALSKLVKQRSAKRQNLTKTVNTITENFPSDETLFNVFINKLNDLKPIISSYDDQILSKLLDMDVLDDQKFSTVSEACDIYMDHLNESKTKLEVGLKNLLANSNANIQPKDSQKIKMPHIELPDFDGKPEEFESFIKNLEDILNKFNFTQYERFTYLCKQVSGEAKKLVSSVPRTGNCYNAARDLLTEAFSNISTQQNSVIKRLINLKLNFEGRLTWLSEMRSIVEQISRLKIDSNVFVQYFLWNGMAASFQREYKILTKKSQPDLKEINEYLFEVFRLVESNYETSSTKASSVTLAANIDKNSKTSYRNGCSLCQKSGKENVVFHKVDECKQYPSVEDKISEIKQHGGCLRCGLLNHSAKSCHYKFTEKCKFCLKDHLSALCFSQTKTAKDRRKNKNFKVDKQKKDSHSTENTQVTTQVVNYSVMNSSADHVDNEISSYWVLNNGSDNDVLLPTVSGKLVGSKKFNRILYDSASQLSFVSEQVLKKAKYSVVQPKYVVKVNGFNESKIFNTKLVKIEILLGAHVRQIIAVVIPEIKTKIDATNLKPVLDSFKNAKIQLADKFLHHNSGTIDILLGADNIHVLPTQSCVLSNNDKNSLFFYCCAGIMLVGKVSSLIENMNKLSSLSDFMHRIDSAF